MLNLSEVLTRLIQFKSISPHDNGCQEFLIEQLQQLGFTCQRFDKPPVSNFYAHYGETKPLLLFAGHTDVVPTGDVTQWKQNPFTLYQEDGYYYGRGVADMKGSLAAMLIACSRLVQTASQWRGGIGLLITSGEEGDDFQCGTPYVMEQLIQQGIKPNYCIVGEPSSSASVGDVIKIGRRGSLNAKLILNGKQGHVAYPHLAENPIHRIMSALNELVGKSWDNGNEYFPPTSLQITHIHAGGEANNVIPGQIKLHFNFRYSTRQTANGLKQQVHDCFQAHGLTPQIEWTLSGEPFLTEKGVLLEAIVQTIYEQTHSTPKLETSGGTSDGRFIAPYGVEVIELGPVNRTIHQINECVAVDDLEKLTDLYYQIAMKLINPATLKLDSN